MTPTNLSRLAAWCKMSHETHRQFVWDTSSGLPVNVSGYPDPTDPGADPREVDRVWLADVMHTLTGLDSPNFHFADVCFVPQMNGGFYCTVDAYVPNSLGRKEHCEFGDSATLALLRAARAAGVPEVVECMGMTAMDKRCGTCAWWDLMKTTSVYHIGRCQAPAPECFRPVNRNTMFHDGGKKCPCYQKRDES